MIYLTTDLFGERETADSPVEDTQSNDVKSSHTDGMPDAHMRLEWGRKHWGIRLIET